MQVVLGQNSTDLFHVNDTTVTGMMLTQLSLKYAIEQNHISFILSYLDQQLPLTIYQQTTSQHPIEWIIQNHYQYKDKTRLFEQFLSTKSIRNQLAITTEQTMIDTEDFEVEDEDDHNLCDAHNISFGALFRMLFENDYNEIRHQNTIELLQTIRYIYPDIPTIIMTNIIYAFLNQHEEVYDLMETEMEVKDARKNIREQFSIMLSFPNHSILDYGKGIINSLINIHSHLLDVIYKRRSMEELNKILLFVVNTYMKRPRLVYQYIDGVHIGNFLQIEDIFMEPVANIINSTLEYGATMDCLKLSISAEKYDLVVSHLTHVNEEKINAPIFDFVNRMIRRRPELSHALSIVASFLTVPTVNIHGILRIPRRIQEVTSLDMPGAKKTKIMHIHTTYRSMYHR